MPFAPDDEQMLYTTPFANITSQDGMHGDTPQHGNRFVTGFPYEVPRAIDLVSLHRLRLESSLDSALAALALIHDTAPLTAAPHFHAPYDRACPAATTPAPKCPTPPKNTDTATYAKAAKAAVAAADHTTAPKVDIVPEVPKPHANEVQHPPTPSLSPPPSPLKAQSPHRSPSPPQAPPQHRPSRPCPHIVFRFDDGISEPPAGQMDFDSVHWSRNGNLGIRFTSGAITTGEAWNRLPAMWGAIRQTLKYPKSTPRPRADTGGPWPSVIVHNVPVPTAASSTESAAEDWLRQGGYEGTVQRITPLSSKETLSTKRTVPYRVSLISMAEAEFLVEHGALLFGSRCPRFDPDSQQHSTSTGYENVMSQPSAKALGKRRQVDEPLHSTHNITPAENPLSYHLFEMAHSSSARFDPDSQQHSTPTGHESVMSQPSAKALGKRRQVDEPVHTASKFSPTGHRFRPQASAFVATMLLIVAHLVNKYRFFSFARLTEIAKHHKVEPFTRRAALKAALQSHSCHVIRED
ncbi:hypothetical protein B0H14DRAFT_2576339 [Mycena olivaceomarginata]|nr:hypothetical protein B0H14DRAFT_2576339 [Mycena olivaceomarginata]